MRRFLLAGLLFCTAPAPARAHDGPPYAIVVDRPTGPYKLSAWADPDVGTGTFIVYLEPGVASTLPESCAVELFVRPHGAGKEIGYRAEPRRHRGARRYDAKVAFDSTGSWRVRFHLASAAGAADAETSVVVTPPGQGPLLDFALYLFPFLAVGFLFVKAAWRRRQPSDRSKSRVGPTARTSDRLSATRRDP